MNTLRAREMGERMTPKIRFGFVCSSLGAVLCLLLAGATPTFGAERVKMVAYEFAPLHMNKGGGAKGYVADLVKHAAERVASESDVTFEPLRFYPWKRAMFIMDNTPNTLFFSIARTMAREDKFHWVSEVSPYELYLFRHGSRTDLQVDSLAEILRRKIKLGVAVGSNTEELLKANGFQVGRDFITYPHYRRGIPMLFRDRFAMMPLTLFVARANVCREGFSGRDVEPVLRLDKLSKPLWMVFSRGTRRELVTRMRNAMTALIEDGTAERLRTRYLADHQNRSCAGR